LNTNLQPVALTTRMLRPREIEVRKWFLRARTGLRKLQCDAWNFNKICSAGGRT